MEELLKKQLEEVLTALHSGKTTERKAKKAKKKAEADFEEADPAKRFDRLALVAMAQSLKNEPRPYGSKALDNLSMLVQAYPDNGTEEMHASWRDVARQCVMIREFQAQGMGEKVLKVLEQGLYSFMAITRAQGLIETIDAQGQPGKTKEWVDLFDDEEGEAVCY